MFFELRKNGCIVMNKHLKDFNLDHFVYMCVGPHVGEPLPHIFERKCKEIEDCGMSLWAFSSGIYKNVKKCIDQREDQNSDVYAVFIKGGKDTSTDKKKTMHYYTDENGKKVLIPNGINVTATASKAKALVVEEYYFINDGEVIDTSEYDNDDPEKFIRGFGFLNKKSNENDKKTEHEVICVAKLKSPFIVQVTEK